MKPWREAATLVLSVRVAAGLRSGSKETRTHDVASSHNKSCEKEDYRVLLLKRSPSNKFMPARLVFPGGVTHEVDHSVDWCRVYSQANLKCDDIAAQLRGPGRRPPMISAERNPADIAPDIAFRISAIRETFEESGLLLCLSQTDRAAVGRGPFAWTKDNLKIDHGVLNNWRERVQKDATQFLAMCEELRLVPNVWALSEWRNWLTPAAEGRQGQTTAGSSKTKPLGAAEKNIPSRTVTIEAPVGVNQTPLPRDLSKSRRFDTMFYLCCMDVKDKLPYTLSDNQETLTAEWFTPTELLHLFSSDSPEASRPHLAPPQFYELTYLQRFNDLDSLYRHTVERWSHGTERWCPLLRLCTDAFIVLLPGDYLYRSPADPEGTQQNSDQLAPPTESLAQLTDQSQPIHRMVFDDSTMSSGGTVVFNLCIK